MEQNYIGVSSLIQSLTFKKFNIKEYFKKSSSRIQPAVRIPHPPTSSWCGRSRGRAWSCTRIRCRSCQSQWPQQHGGWTEGSSPRRICPRRRHRDHRRLRMEDVNWRNKCAYTRSLFGFLHFSKFNHLSRIMLNLMGSQAINLISGSKKQKLTFWADKIAPFLFLLLFLLYTDLRCEVGQFLASDDVTIRFGADQLGAMEYEILMIILDRMYKLRICYL